VAPARPALADDAHDGDARPGGPRPSREDLADDRIEPLFGIAQRRQQIRIHLAQHQSPADRRIGLALAIADEDAAGGLRAVVVGARQPVQAGGDDERHRLAGLARLREARESRGRAAVGQHAVVGLEPPLESGREGGERLGILVDHEQDRLSHGFLRSSRA
jgi:hypothetical protein